MLLHWNSVDMVGGGYSGWLVKRLTSVLLLGASSFNVILAFSDLGVVERPGEQLGLLWRRPKVDHKVPLSCPLYRHIV